MNLWTVIGRLGRDPELRYTPSGAAVCNFSLAVDPRLKKDREGEKNPPLWVKVTAWNKTAENLAKYLTKGQRVCVTGEAGLEHYEKKDGGEVYQVTLNAQSFSFIDFADDGGSGRAERKTRDRDSEARSNSGRDNGGPPIDDEDIPF